LFDANIVATQNLLIISLTQQSSLKAMEKNNLLRMDNIGIVVASLDEAIAFFHGYIFAFFNSSILFPLG